MLRATLENVLNRGLPRSPRARQLCAELAGRRVAVAAAPASFAELPRVLVESTGECLKLRAVSTEALAGMSIDASISGGPLSLFALAGPAPETVLQRGAVRIEGDAEFMSPSAEARPSLEDDCPNRGLRGNLER